ncbi:uncharacterized protein [Dermacentor albipictus]|uniref:uncharacterized protein n=1 Tax=Dermacentor albipictus TaxID=60249 RepID=UPI0038FBFF4D
MPLEAFFRSGVSSIPVALVLLHGGAIRLNYPKAVQAELQGATHHYLHITDVHATLLSQIKAFVRDEVARLLSLISNPPEATKFARLLANPREWVSAKLIKDIIIIIIIIIIMMRLCEQPCENASSSRRQKSAVRDPVELVLWVRATVWGTRQGKTASGAASGRSELEPSPTLATAAIMDASPTELRMAAADRPQTPCPGPAPMLHRTVLGVEASLPSGTASGARPKAFHAAVVPSVPGRRKPWDLQGRLHDLQERLKSMKSEKEQLIHQNTSQLEELEKLNAELIIERRKNAALTTRVSELESALSSSEAQKLSARAVSDSLLTELHSAAQQVATLGQSLANTAGAFAALTCDDAALMENDVHHETTRQNL